MSNLRKAEAHLARAAYYRYRFGSDDCAICFYSLSEKGETVTCPNGHTFHKECMMKFMKRAEGEKNICPTCRQPFFNDTQIKDLPPDVKALLQSDDVVDFEILNEITAAQLSGMLQRTGTIQNTLFTKVDWRRAGIGSHEVVYSFIRCTIQGNVFAAEFSNIQFHSCTFSYNHPSPMSNFNRCKLHSVKFINVKLVSTNMQMVTFDKCEFQGEASHTLFRNSTFQDGVMHDFTITQKVVVDDDADADDFYGEDDAIMYKCKFNNMRFESCEWVHVDCRLSEFRNCTVINCNFYNNNMTGVTFTHCTFNQCNFEATWLIKCIFKDCKITECNFTEADLNYSIFSSGDIELKCVISHCDFTGTFAPGVSFLNCMIVSNTFTNSLLQHTKFASSTLQQCKFNNANLTDASFTKSRLLQCSFDRENIMRGARFNKTDITDCEIHSHLKDINFAGSQIRRTVLGDPYEGAPLHCDECL